ncbi:23668_t:CDS:2 [Cetraspora pellucida]|uniref:23668_t:CDS:1 n=1 Tax=Cetraspora pellucida TaxID=1433469 RepID=A0A9N8ZA31_9GLOM|nr:23668_t:CDS:2 [Cetraspora pellucida]
MSSDLYEAYTKCKNIVEIGKTALYNKTIHRYLVRVAILSAEPIVKLLQFQINCQGNAISNEKLIRFKDSLVDIEKLIKCVTQIYGSIEQNYEDLESIKDYFDQIMKEYWACVKDLNPKFSKMHDMVEQEYLRDDEIEDFIKKQFLVKDKKLNHGLIISDRGINSRYEFEPRLEIKINPINSDTRKFYINLVPIKTQRDTLLKYNIKPSTISSEYFQLVSNQLVNRPPNDVYLEIQYPRWELVFKTKEMKLPEKFIRDIKDSLNSCNPYHKLIQKFGNYGHFVPKKVILGHKLHRMSCLQNDATLAGEQRIKTSEYFITDEFKELWDRWCNSIHVNLNQSYLLSMNSNIFKREELIKWAESCLNDNNDMQIISWELYPLYELLDDNLKRSVNAIFGMDNIKVKNKVLMSGVISITDSFYYFIKFPYKLNTENYQIFGKLVAQDGKPLNTVIKFKALTPHSFAVFIDINQTMSMHSNLQILWIMVGLPTIGFYSPNTRDISILASDRYEFAYAKQLIVAFPVPENLPTNWILCISFQYLKDCGPNFRTIVQYDKINHKITFVIYDEFSISPKIYDKLKKEYLLHWCILPEGHEVLADVFKKREVLIDVLPNNKNLTSIIESQEILTTVSPEERFNLSLIGQGNMT